MKNLGGLSALALILLSSPLRAASAGSISGTVHDISGAIIPGAKLTLLNVSLRTEIESTSDGQGSYSFPALSVGFYEITVEATGFKAQRKVNLTVDADAALRLDVVLEVGQKSDEVTVVEADSKI